MAEAIISRRAKTEVPTVISHKIALITENTVWTVPWAEDNKFDVRIFGGGGGGYTGSTASGGGGGGWMNNAELELNYGDDIIITIGAGGNVQGSGGTTSFGSYLSANGGGAGLRGGNGGSGGGGVLHYNALNMSNNPTTVMYYRGGNGGQFGGGSPGGSGGPWGGGAGGSVVYVRMNCNNGLRSNNCFIAGNPGIGGIYGGNGGVIDLSNNYYDGNNGINTIGLLGDSSIEGYGWGATKSNILVNNTYTSYYTYASGAGGGYGGCGGES